MTIRIERNSAGNCITFHGQTNPVYYNACLTAEVIDTDYVNIINEIASNEFETRYEFYRVHFSEFQSADFNVFSSAQEAVDYINKAGQVQAQNDSFILGPEDTLDFILDDTNTSVIFDNGDHHGVNSIKAVALPNGLVSIQAMRSDHEFYQLPHTGCSINGTAVPGGINDVVDALNEYFTVGAFEQVVIRDPYSTLVADVAGVDTNMTILGVNGVDPVGDDVYGSTKSTNFSGFKSLETIDQAGEYFTFDIRNEAVIGFGLVMTDSTFSNGTYPSGTNATYADPATFAVGNSSHYGFQFSHWFHPSPNGPWTNYGANTSYVTGPGWSNSSLRFSSSPEGADWLAGNPVKIKVGLDANSFIEIAYYDVSESSWVVCARSGYPVPEGAEFHLGIKCADSVGRVYTTPKIHELEPAAPTMYFRWIESPDGVFQFPIFASEEEANYYDTDKGGSGTSTQRVFEDEPTFSTWYTPDTGYTNNGIAAPVAETFDGNLVNYTEITSLTNAALVPTAYTDQTIEVNELQAVNIQLAPQGVGYTTTITDNDGAGFALVGGYELQGTAPEVTSDNVSNPSDDYTVTVTRTNSYGSSTGTLTVRVLNLTAPSTAISGFNHHAASTSLVDSDTMDDGSAIQMNNTVADGKRFIIDSSYVETNILPALQGTGDKYYIGLAVNGHDFSSVDDADFDSAIVWEYETASSHTFKFINNGSVVNNIVVSSMTSAFYDFAIEINGTSAWLIACNVNSINTQPSPADGGSFSHTYESTNLDESAPHTIHMAVVSTQGDFSTTDLSQIDTPVASGTLTSWTKALDFSGSSERAQKVNASNDSSPIKQIYSSTHSAWVVNNNTHSSSNARPWAVTCVFKIDGNASNQHIWNQGEGANVTDDNIYLRLDANKRLYFGWGRSGALNECKLSDLSSLVNEWHAVYIAHNGVRLSGSDATATNLANMFDIHYARSGNSWAVSGNQSTWTNWNVGSTGGRMDRSVLGEFTIGGRGANRSFHGQVAMCMVNTLKLNTAMPNTTEIEMMMTDPLQWQLDYRVGQTYRPANQGTNLTNYQIGQGQAIYATQMWLMGDGTNDSYSNMIRNQADPTDQNYTKLNLISMVSNDIQNVTISGLS